MKIDTLKEKLLVLKNTFGLVALKTGTEIEDMGLDEIKVMQSICSNIVPITVKIGGPEARQDIRAMLTLKIDMILAPMVESVYALSNFVDTVHELSPYYNHMPQLGINIETITGVQKIDSILNSPSFQKIEHITIGRGDLAKSMGLLPDDDDALKISNEVIQKINILGKTTSSGGGVSLHNIHKLRASLSSTYFNTRHIVFSNNTSLNTNAIDILSNILAFEQDIYRFFSEVFPERKEDYQKRIDVLDLRLSK